MNVITSFAKLKTTFFVMVFSLIRFAIVFCYMLKQRYFTEYIGNNYRFSSLFMAANFHWRYKCSARIYIFYFIDEIYMN